MEAIGDRKNIISISRDSEASHISLQDLKPGDAISLVINKKPETSSDKKRKIFVVNQYEKRVSVVDRP